MIKIEKVEVTGWMAAIRGMRNPKNSWALSDTEFTGDVPNIGKNDLGLMMRLAKGGPVHAKYRRFITVTFDVTAPLYWWKEADKYQVGVVTNSCSTMHKLHTRDLKTEDFSYEKLSPASLSVLISTIDAINKARKKFVDTGNKDHWDNMIQLLPSSYNQKRTVILNYEVLSNIYHSRKNHKLSEWREFCEWIESLPYSEIITAEVSKADE